MTTTRIRPVSDLRNKYPDIETELKSGPVYPTRKALADIREKCNV